MKIGDQVWLYISRVGHGIFKVKGVIVGAAKAPEHFKVEYTIPGSQRTARTWRLKEALIAV